MVSGWRGCERDLLPLVKCRGRQIGRNVPEDGRRGVGNSKPCRLQFPFASAISTAMTNRTHELESVHAAVAAQLLAVRVLLVGVFAPTPRIG
jgi:hypothetical protein